MSFCFDFFFLSASSESLSPDVRAVFKNHRIENTDRCVCDTQPWNFAIQSNHLINVSSVTLERETILI